MKTMKTICALILGTFIIGSVSATEGNLNVSFESATADLAVVEMSSSKMSQFEVDVTDAYGEELYSSKSIAPSNSLKKKYDFSNLEDGTYWLKVKIDRETTTKKMEIENGKVDIIESRKSVDPYFIMDDKMLKVSYMNYHNDDVRLYVYNGSNQLVTEAKLGDDFSIHKAVDFSDSYRGTYDVVISNDTDLYEYQVTID